MGEAKTVEPIIPPDFFEKIMQEATGQTIVGLKQGLVAFAPTFWAILPYLTIVWLVVGVVVFVKAVGGRWGAFGSWLYHTFYTVVMGLLIWIGGLEILFNTYFDLFSLGFYFFCFWLSGRVLKGMGFIK